MTWEDLADVQKRVEVGTPAPLELSAWADRWLWAIKELRGLDFYKPGKGALMTHPFKGVPDWFNDGIHKMLGSGARQAWIYVSFHTGIPMPELSAAFGELKDTNWQHNYNAQLEFFALVKDPGVFCGAAYRKVQGTPEEQYVRLMIKAVAAIRVRQIVDTLTDTTQHIRGALQDVAQSETPPILGPNRVAGSMMRSQNWYPLFKDAAVKQPLP